MREIFQTIKSTRINQGLTQMELAHQSDVGLATIQNIEAGKTNPTLGVLGSILRVLGISLTLYARLPNVEEGISLGLPMTSATKIPIAGTKENLISYLRTSLPQVSRIQDQRFQDALLALALATMIHYPSTFQKLNLSSDANQALLGAMSNGHVIKLKRIAAANLSVYL